MIKFDSAETAAALTRRKLYGKITVGYITALILSAVCLAAFSGYAEKNWNLYIVFLSLYSLALLSFILYLIFFGAKPGRELNLAVCKTVAEGCCTREDLFKGDNVRLTVNYSGDTLTLAREGYTGEIIISPVSFKGGSKVADGGAEIQFDLSALKSAPSVYSSVGEKLLSFLQAYYFVNTKKLNASSVTVTDATGGKPCEIIIVDNGKPVAAENNYYVKRGLIHD